MPDRRAAEQRTTVSVLTSGIGVMVCALLLAAGAAAQHTTPAQVASSDLSVPPMRWAEAAVGTEERIINFDGNALLRYRTRRVDAKGEAVREVIESKEGTVARLVEHNGQPLTAEENNDERERLQAILDHPDAFLRHIRREAGGRSYAVELLHNMPKAMLWSYVPGQPQLANASGPAVVLDFKPDPQFKPPSLITEALTGIAGRVWVDVATHYVTRIQGTILHPVDFGWGGVLARIREGGVVVLEQQQAANQRWLYSRLSEHITIREMLVHTTEENVEMTASNLQPLPHAIPFQEAVHLLLAMPVTTR